MTACFEFVYDIVRLVENSERIWHSAGANASVRLFVSVRSNDLNPGFVFIGDQLAIRAEWLARFSRVCMAFLSKSSHKYVILNEFEKISGMEKPLHGLL